MVSVSNICLSHVTGYMNEVTNWKWSRDGNPPLPIALFGSSCHLMCPKRMCSMLLWYGWRHRVSEWRTAVVILQYHVLLCVVQCVTCTSCISFHSQERFVFLFWLESLESVCCPNVGFNLLSGSKAMCDWGVAVTCRSAGLLLHEQSNSLQLGSPTSVWLDCVAKSLWLRK